MEIFGQFDTYSLKARVFPALIAGFPTLLLLFVLVPRDHLALSQVIAASMGLTLLFAFADMVRHRENHCYASWDTYNKRDWLTERAGLMRTLAYETSTTT